MDPVWIERSPDGPIKGVYANKQEGYAEEQIAGDDPAVIAFLNPPPPVPQSISDRQFFQQLAVMGIITQDAALASNAAVIPGPLLAIIDQMPADQQFNAKMIISGATVYNRTDDLTIGIGTAYGWTSDQIDAFFTAAAEL